MTPRLGLLIRLRSGSRARPYPVSGREWEYALAFERAGLAARGGDQHFYLTQLGNDLLRGPVLGWVINGGHHMTAQAQLSAEVDKMTTAQLQETARMLKDNLTPEADIVMAEVLRVLETRMDADRYERFCAKLEN